MAESILTTIEEARVAPDVEQWEAAMNEERLSLEKNGTWILVDLPEDRKSIKNK